MKDLLALIFFVCVLVERSDAQDTLRTTDGVVARVETIVQGLEVPWSMAFAPGGDLYFTERPGRINLLEKGAKEHRVIAHLEEVHDRGEGGLMGLTLHPEFRRNGWIYVAYTSYSFFQTKNQVVRFTLRNGKLEERRVIIDDLPGANVHNGCRLAFGPMSRPETQPRGIPHKSWTAKGARSFVSKMTGSFLQTIPLVLIRPSLQ
jgi:glucose/arabinose dehydrogenase